MYKTVLLIYNDNAGQADIEQTIQSIISILFKGITNLMLSKTEKEVDAELIAKMQGDNYFFRWRWDIA